MNNIHLHNVVVNNKTLEILSADTGFYEYIGDERFFNSFEKLVHPAAQERFLSIIREEKTEPFVIDMVKINGDIVLTYMCISYSKEHLSIELEGVLELREGQEQYRKLYNLHQDLHGLHNDTVFIYNESSNKVKLYTSDFRRCTTTYLYDEFVQDLKENVSSQEQDVLESFLVSLKNESGSFAYNFSGRILSISKECKNSIVKGMTVKNIEGITTIGYIHRGSNKGTVSHTIEKDALTDTYSKREIANIARKAIEKDKLKNTAICIIDIDYFKRVNDQFGHMMGDVVLKEIAQIIKDEVGYNGDVGRFGGDEFFAVLYDIVDATQLRNLLRGIKNRVSTRFPGSEDGSTVAATLSIGCAQYPLDAANYDDLFCLADFCLFRAKDKGRNRYIIYHTHMHGSLEQIKNFFSNSRRIDSRKDMAMGDVLCMIGDKHFQDDTYTPEMLVDDLVENLPIDRIICLSGEPLMHRCMSGVNLQPVDIINKCCAVLNTVDVSARFVGNVWIVDNIEILKNVNEDIYNVYKKMEVKSFVLVKFQDKSGKDAMVSLEMTTTNLSWNLNQMYNYRTIARMFAWFDL